MLNKKHSLKSGKKKQGQEKGIWKEKQDRKQQKRKDWWKQTAIKCFDVPFMKQNKEEKETKGKKETKRRNQKKATKKDKKEETN